MLSNVSKTQQLKSNLMEQNSSWLFRNKHPNMQYETDVCSEQKSSERCFFFRSLN